MAYNRKTYDEYQIHGYYAHGWEEVTSEETRKAAREQLKCYRENDPCTPYKIIKRRVRITEG